MQSNFQAESWQMERDESQHRKNLHSNFSTEFQSSYQIAWKPLSTAPENFDLNKIEHNFI